MLPYYDTVITIFLQLSMLFLSGIVLAYKPALRVSRAFFVLVLLIIAWSSAGYLEYVTEFSLEMRRLFVHLDFAYGIAAVTGLLAFVLLLAHPTLSTRKVLLATLPGFVLAVFSVTPLVVADAVFDPLPTVRNVAGPLYVVYVLFIFAYLLATVVVLARARKQASDEMRRQIVPILYGVVGLALVTAVFSLLLQDRVSPTMLRLAVMPPMLFVVGIAWLMASAEFQNKRFVLVHVLSIGLLSLLLGRVIEAPALKDFFVGTCAIFGVFALHAFMVSMFHDAAVRERQLAEANRYLKEMDTRKSEFIAMASHELRTPVTVLAGYVALMEEGAYGKVPVKMREKIETMLQMSTRMARFIDNMLNVARIEADSVTYLCENTELGTLVRHAAQILEGRAAVRDLTIRVIAQESVQAYVDVEKVTAIVSNLIENAIKYSDHGEITVTVAHNKTGQCAEITVRDQGMGMSPETAAKAFDKFFRANDPNVLAMGGAGIGLFVCSTYARAMGGHVWIKETAIGKGTTISVVLPLLAGQRCAPAKKT